MPDSIWNVPNWGDGTFVDPTSTGGGTGGGSGAGTPISIVQVAPAVIQRDTGSGTHTVTLTFPGNLTPGNTVLVAATGNCNGPLSDLGSPSVTDSAIPTPNSYTQLFFQDAGGNSDGGGGGLFLSVIVAATNTVTFSYVGTPGAFSSPFEIGATAVEYSGMGASPTLQDKQFQRIFGTAGTNPSVLTITDSRSASVSVTIETQLTFPNGLGSQNTFTALADILCGTVDYLVVFALSQTPSVLLPTTSPGGYATFTQESLATDVANGYSVLYWDPGSLTGGLGGGGGSATIVITPIQGIAGQTYNIAVIGTGTHFDATTAVTVSGGGVTVSNVVVTDATDLRFTLALAPGAALGARTVTTQTGAEVPTAVFTVLQATVTAVKRGDIGWSQIRLGLDGTYGAGAYGQSTDGSGSAGIIPVWGGPDGITLVASTLTAGSLNTQLLATPLLDASGNPIFDANGNWIFAG